MNLFKIYRVKGWYYYLGFILIGFFLTSSISLKLLVLLLFGSFLLAYAFSFNDFWDEDKKTYFLFPLFSSIFLFPLLNITQIILASIFLFIVTVYSAKPLRLKAKPFLSSFCNGIGFSILFLLGYCVNSFSIVGLSLFLLFLCFNMVAQFIHEVVHMKDDRKNKITTTALCLGEEGIKKLSYLFLFVSLCISIYLFYVKILYLISFLATVIFTIFFIIEINMKKIDIGLRKKYRNIGFILGLIYLISFIIEI